MLAVGATTTFSRSLDNWFNRQTTSIVMSSLDVAHAYLEEHGQVIRTDIVNMAKDLDDAAPQLAGDPRKFRELVFAQAGLRDLPVAYVIDTKGDVKVAALEDKRIPYVAPPAHLIQAAEAGQVPLLMPINSVSRRGHRQAAQLSRCVSLRRPRRQSEGGRGTCAAPKLASPNTSSCAAQRRPEIGARAHVFHDLADRLLAAIWIGLWFAGGFVAPIRRLISAAQQVAIATEGRAADQRGEGDLRRLSANFNHHDQQLEHQRSELVSANAQLTERGRFMEAVLSGVSAGVSGSTAAAASRLPTARPRSCWG